MLDVMKKQSCVHSTYYVKPRNIDKKSKRSLKDWRKKLAKIEEWQGRVNIVGYFVQDGFCVLLGVRQNDGNYCSFANEGLKSDMVKMAFWLET